MMRRAVLRFREAFMAYIAGVDRSQQVMFPEALDDYVGPEHPVRFIDAFVASLDLADLGVARAVPNALGRPAYDPGDLLRLYVYGYLNRIRTSRRLEREAQRNVELMWLLRRLAPDFKTIAEFRRANAAALTRVCREFTLLCKQLDLFGGELVAIDGSKFRAVNGRQRNVTTKDLEKRLQRLDAQIAEYLAALEASDRAEAAAASRGAGGDGPGSGGGSGGGTSFAEKLAVLRERKAAYTALQADMDATGDTQRSLTDLESRLMKVGMGVQVCYNVQTAVDAKHKLIIAHDVTNDVTDHAWLSPLAKAANEVLASPALHVIADRGYYKAPEIAACLDAGITPTVPRPETSSSAAQGLFTKADFSYDAARDEYQCPAGARLTYRASRVDRTGIMQRRYATAACGACPRRAQCTRAKHGGRYILRWEKEGLLEAMATRLAERPELRTTRQELAEHPYGTIKRGWDQGYFLTRGLAKVRGEMSLTVLAYNLRRALNILGVPKLLDAMAGRLLGPQYVTASV